VLSQKYPGVQLSSGLFTLKLDFTSKQFHSVFNGKDVAYIEVIDLTNGRKMPRQSFSAVPYALKVPVDGSSLVFNDNGELTVAPSVLNSQPEIDATSDLETGSFTTNKPAGIVVESFGTNAGETGEIRFKEPQGKQNDYVGFKAPDDVTTTQIWTLPQADGNNGDVLQTNGSGALSWTATGGANTNAGTICSAGEYLDGDGTCKTVPAIANAGTLCNAGEYLDGDTTCKAIPVDTDTSASTACGPNHYLDGDGSCYPISATGRALLDDGDAATQRATLGLGNVENTQLSTWSGTNSITTLGTISTGVWQGSDIGATYIDDTIARDSEVTYKTEGDLTTVLDDNYAHMDGQNGALTLGTNDGNNLSLETNNAVAVTIDATGQVGIGSTNPQVALDIAAASGIRAQQICDEAGANCKDISTGWGGGAGDMLSTNNLSDLANATTARSNLGLSNVENTALSTWAGTTNVTTLGTVTSGNVDAIVNSGSVGLGNVENTALSTWAGTSNVTTLGTVTSGNLDAIVNSGSVGLGNVENTALSTWAGTTNVTTLGTVTTGNVDAIVDASSVGLDNVTNESKSTMLDDAALTGATTATAQATTEVPVTIDSPTGQTANLQNWQVNGATMAYMDAAGKINVLEICDAAGANCTTPAAIGSGAGDLLSTNNLSDLANASTARSNLGLSNVENTALSTWAGTTNITTLGTVTSGNVDAIVNSGSVGLGNVENTALSTWAGSTNVTTLGTITTGDVDAIVNSSSVGLGNVENTALSTWAGTSNVTTLGTIATGVWQGTDIGETYIDDTIARDSEITYKTEGDLTSALDDNYAQLGGQNGAIALGANDSNSVNLLTNGANRLTINSAGNVGIGSTSPTAKLDVAGLVKSTALQVVDGNQQAGRVLTADGSGNASWQDPAGGNPAYGAGGTAPVNSVYISNGGKVGIGSTTPVAALDVNGAVSTGNGGIRWKTFEGTFSGGTTTTFSHGLAASNIVDLSCVGKTNTNYKLMNYLNSGNESRLISFDGTTVTIDHQGAETFGGNQFRCVAQYVDVVADVDGFAAVTGTNLTGDIDVTIDFPGDTSKYDHVEIRRIAGATAPVATCDGGSDDVTTYNSYTDDSYTDTFASEGTVGGSVYSYRVCVFGTDASLTSFAIAENVMARLPADVDGFTAVQGVTTAGDIDLTIDFPGAGETASYSNVEIRRVDGATPPVATCDGGGDNVTNYTTYTDDSFTQSLTENQFYSYRVCVWGIDGSLVSTTTIANVRAKPDKHYVFVTSGTYQGNLGGVAGADATCTSLANTAGYIGSFKALLSTTTVDVKDRISINAIVYNTLDQKVADNEADFWDNSLDLRIDRDQNGTQRSNSYVWSGSNSNGTRHVDTVWDDMCTNWTTNSGSRDALFGWSSGQNGDDWLGWDNVDLECNQSMRIYCISQ
jgi:hypothetical protein